MVVATISGAVGSHKCDISHCEIYNLSCNRRKCDCDGISSSFKRDRGGQKRLLKTNNCDKKSCCLMIFYVN